MENQSFSHILQQKGILKSFSIAKVMNEAEIKKLDATIKRTSKSKKEYNKIFKKELAKISDAYDKKNPIPGIIHPDATFVRRKALFEMANEIADTMKMQKIK
jgi:hypothetical protein